MIQRKCLLYRFLAGQLITVINKIIEMSNTAKNLLVFFFKFIKLGTRNVENMFIDCETNNRERNIYKYAFNRNLLQVKRPLLNELKAIPRIANMDNMNSISNWFI